MGSIANLIVRRSVTSVFVLWLVTTFVFFFLRLVGDPITLIAGDDPTPEALAIAIQRYGLDEPVLAQYWDYIQGVVRGDFGESFRYNEPAWAIVTERFPATFQRAGLAFTLGILIAVPVGIYSAIRPGSLIDNASRVVAVLGQSMPVFWFGLLMMVLFAVNLGWFPAVGSGTARHLVLPATTLAVYSLPLSMRLVRSTMLDIMTQEYVKTARAKGLSERSVILDHAFRNALIPVVNVLALRLGALITGAVVLEEVFGYPGLGRLAIGSMRLLDYNVVQAFVFIVAAMIIVVNLVTDIIFGLVDPRVRVS